MKALFFGLFIRQTIIYNILFCCVLILMLKVNEVPGTPDLKTRLLLQNIRTHLAQKAEEVIQQKECESGLILCKDFAKKSAKDEEEKSDEIEQPPKILRGYHKSNKIKSKDVKQTKLLKVPKNLYIKPEKEDITPKLVHFQRLHKTSKINLIERKINEKNKKSEINEEESTEIPLEQQIPKKKEKQRQEAEMILTKVEKRKVEIKRNEVTSKTRIEEKKEKLEEKKQDKQVRNFDNNNQKVLNGKRREAQKPLDEPIFPSDTFIFSMDSNILDNKLCKKHNNIYRKQLQKYKIWALMMYDASAKLPSGILQGNANQYGDFDECLSINAVFKKTNAKKDLPAIKGKYCMATIDLNTEFTNNSLNQVLDRIKSFSFVQSTVYDPSHFVPRFSSINWGLCVPHACLANDVENLVKHQLGRINSSTNLRFNVNIEEGNCVVKEDLKFKFNGIFLGVLTFYALVTVAALYATYVDTNEENKLSNLTKYENLGEEEPENFHAETVSVPSVNSPPSTKRIWKRILLAFSLKRSWMRLTEEEDDAIRCINGIKAIFSIMLYLAHKTIPLGWTSFSNRTFLTKVTNEWATVLLRTSIIYTDSFLLMSGVLTAYNLTREISNKGKIKWGKRIVARYIRLTPALLAVLLFYAYVWDHLGSGPLWNTLVKQNALLCQKYMWRNLLYLQNLFAFEYMCAPQTHQLALDMQLSALAPLFIYILHNYDKTGFGILQAIFLLSSIVRYTATMNNELSVIVYHGIPVSQLYKTANKLYAQTLHRASPYLMGVIVGHYLQRYNGQIRIANPKLLTVVGWIIALSLGFYSAVLPHNTAYKTYKYDVMEASQYAALSPVSWSVALAWLIVACHLGFGGKLNQFLSNKGLLIFSRISYSFYLTQFLVFFYKVGSKRIPEVFSISESISTTEFVTVVVISFILTLLFDIPMMEIKKIILDKTATEILFKESDPTEKKLNVERNFDEFEDEDENFEKDREEIDEEIPEEESDGCVDQDAEEATDGSRDNDIGGDSEDADAEETDEVEGEEICQDEPLRRAFKMHFDEYQDDWIGKINE